MLNSGWLPFIIAGLVALIVAGAGGWATDIGAWYYQLKKPVWQPPDWVFGPVWTIIYLLTAIAAGLAWQAIPGASAKFWLLALFLLNSVLNVLWSVLFFSLKQPVWAFVDIIALWLTILALGILIAPYSIKASLLLAPYLGWVSFAAVLNRAIIQLNPGV